MTPSSVVNAVGAHGLRDVSKSVRFRHLLCPTDLSDTSAAALECAADIARATGAEITALFVFPAVRPYGAEGAEPAPLLPDAGVRSVVAKDLEGFVRAARESGASVRARFEVGDPATEVLNAAVETKADAIVMGTHGRSGIERWILGSVAQKVLRGAACPVLTVSAHREEEPVTRSVTGPIFCAVDLGDSSPGTLRHALYLGRATGRPITVAHVVEDPWQYEAAAPHAHVEWGSIRRELAEDATGRLRRLLLAECEEGEDVERLVTSGKPYREILRLAEEQAAGLIVMGRHGRPPGPAGLFGSNADHVMRAARCPVLTVRGV